ncbi:truncated acyl-CoA synthetase [Methanothermobacter sp. CaT2]|nr:truncated acyl-CoA synthetase [Methanothermobacter sp. CaT2]
MVFTEDTIGEFFEKQVERYADKEFIVYPDRDLRFTYREFNERVNLLAKGLLSIGIGRGTTLVSGQPMYLTGSPSCSQLQR